MSNANANVVKEQRKRACSLANSIFAGYGRPEQVTHLIEHIRTQVPDACIPSLELTLTRFFLKMVTELRTMFETVQHLAQLRGVEYVTEDGTIVPPDTTVTPLDEEKEKETETETK